MDAPAQPGAQREHQKADFAPFLAPDEKTLYFASEGRGGYGKSDIFYTKRLDDTWTNWSPPRNLGSVVNSPDFDAYYTVSAAGRRRLSGVDAQRHGRLERHFSHFSGPCLPARSA
ncbi:MAG: hypothetical protein WKG07_24040 [Hymenobacter sp.]